MGEIANEILDGTRDAETAELLGKAVGYPRTAHDEQAVRRAKRTRDRRERRIRSKRRRAAEMAST